MGWLVVLAAFIGGFVAVSGWASWSLWNERRRGMHLHSATGVLHSHVDGHKPHIHPLSATATGWRKVKALWWEQEMETADALDIHSPIPDDGPSEGEFPWWHPRGQR